MGITSFILSPLGYQIDESLKCSISVHQLKGIFILVCVCEKEGCCDLQYLRLVILDGKPSSVLFSKAHLCADGQPYLEKAVYDLFANIVGVVLKQWRSVQ